MPTSYENNITLTTFESNQDWPEGPKKPDIAYSSEGWITEAAAITAFNGDIKTEILLAISQGKDVSLIIKARQVTT